MINSKYINKHFLQIKKGGVTVINKKLKSLFYLFLTSPFYILAILAVIILYLIRPWFLIRWHGFNSSRIGHFAIETELYCCMRDVGINIPSQRYIDFFYLSRKYVCNRQLEKMWRRTLIILPRWLLIPLSRVNHFFSFFIPSGKKHEVGYEIGYTTTSHRDAHNLLEKRFGPHLNFTDDEEIKGKKILTEWGIPKDAKFVCLIVRDSSYLDRQKKYNLRDWSYHNYRDADIDNYVLAAEELARRGYYIFRMGAKVLKPLKSSNPKIIDYAVSGARSEFMDIYLGAKCNFCIETGLGFGQIPQIFGKPIVYTNYAYIGTIIAGNKKSLILLKHHVHKKNKKRLTISEIFSSNVAFFIVGEEFEQNDVALEENSPEEIRDIVIEMDERLNENWKETREDLLLQKKFWSIFSNNIKKLNLEKPIHGKIKSKFGAKFLRENKNWIN